MIESLVLFAGVLGALYLVVLPILVIVALRRTSTLTDELSILRDRVRKLAREAARPNAATDTAEAEPTPAPTPRPEA